MTPKYQYRTLSPTFVASSAEDMLKMEQQLQAIDKVFSFRHNSSSNSVPVKMEGIHIRPRFGEIEYIQVNDGGRIATMWGGTDPHVVLMVNGTEEFSLIVYLKAEKK